MKKSLILITLLATLCMASNVFAQDAGSGNVKTDIARVIAFPVHEGDTPVVIHQAGSSLSRNNTGMFWSISTSGLPVGEVVTLWVGIFNNPSACDQTIPGCFPSDLANPLVNGSLQYGGGAIVGANGRADFSGYLPVGDNSGYFILPPFVGSMPDPAPGLVNPKGAEVHLVIRKHGQASNDPAILQAQLSSFGGGCNVAGACANIQASVH
jgi:hypothetical protein